MLFHDSIIAHLCAICIMRYRLNSHGVFGHSYDEDTHFLERVHYAGNWDVLRPAREVSGVNPITESEINALLQEAERIIDKLRVTA